MAGIWFLCFLSTYMRERKEDKKPFRMLFWDETEETIEEETYSVDLSLRHVVEECEDEKPQSPLR